MNWRMQVYDKMALVGLATATYGLYLWFGKGVALVWLGVWMFIIGLAQVASEM